MEPIKWRQFLEDKGNQNLSATRLVLLLWAVSVLVIWVIVSLRTTTLQSIPDSVVTILGVSFGAKVVQRFGEKGSGGLSARGGTP